MRNEFHNKRMRQVFPNEISNGCLCKRRYWVSKTEILISYIHLVLIIPGRKGGKGLVDISVCFIHALLKVAQNSFQHFPRHRF